MTESETPLPEAALARTPLRRRLLYALPVLAFMGLAVALAFGLQHDPSLVPSPLIGKPAPRTALEPVPEFGPAFTNADFQGHVTLVNVFASWCVSCRDEHPLLVRLAEQQGARIFGIAYKDAPTDAAGWLTVYGNPYSGTGLDLDGRAGIDWGVYGVPETFLVGPDGIIAYKKIGAITPEDVEGELLPRMAALQVEADAMAADAAAVPDGNGGAIIAASAATLPNLAWLDDPRPLPDIGFYLADGSEATFDRFRGKAMVLNFWATWCPPCRAEMPSLDRLAAAYGGDDLAVVTMSLDRGGEAQIAEFYDEIGAGHLGIYHDPTMAVSRALRVFGLPTTVLVDHNGRVVAELVGPAEWDSPAALAAILPLADAARTARLGTAQQAAADN